MGGFYFELSHRERVLCTIQELAYDLEGRVTNSGHRIMKWDRKSHQAEELLDGVENPTDDLLLLKRLFEALGGLIMQPHDVPDLDELLNSAAAVTAGTEFAYIRTVTLS